MELAFPLGLPSEFAITGKAFIDVGSLRGAETSLSGSHRYGLAARLGGRRHSPGARRSGRFASIWRGPC